MMLPLALGVRTPASVEEPVLRRPRAPAARGSAGRTSRPPARPRRSQQAVVDEHAGQLVADRLVHQQRGHGRVDAAGERADRLVVADLVADPRHLLVDELVRRPVGRQPRTRRRGTAQHLGAVRACAPPRDGTARRTESALAVLHGRDRGGLASTAVTRNPAAARSRCRGGSSSRSARAACRRTAGCPRLSRHRRLAILAEPGVPDRRRPARPPSPACRSRCPAPARPAANSSGSTVRCARLVDRGGAAGQHDPDGSRAATSAADTSCGTISE